MLRLWEVDSLIHYKVGRDPEDAPEPGVVHKGAAQNRPVSISGRYFRPARFRETGGCRQL